MWVCVKRSGPQNRWLPGGFPLEHALFSFGCNGHLSRQDLCFYAENVFANGGREAPPLWVVEVAPVNRVNFGVQSLRSATALNEAPDRLEPHLKP